MMEPLLDKVKEYLPDYRLSLLNNLLLLVLCLLDGGTVNLYQLRGHVAKFTGQPSSAASGYKRLIRIFDSGAHSRLWLDLLLLGFRLLRLDSRYLILDGTSWKRNGTIRHFLTLSVEYGSVAIPIYWVDLAKLGISSEKERRALFKRVLRHFDLRGKVLLADREYIGIEWFKFLNDREIDFTVRLRAKNYREAIDASPGKSYLQLIGKAMRSKLPYKALGKAVWIDGRQYMFVAAKYRDQSGIPCTLLLLSSLQDSPAAIAGAYLRRWKIESCFRHLKSNGFNLEQVNLRGEARSKLLMAAMVFAYVLSIHEGLKTYKKVRDVSRSDGTIHKAESLFRHGFDNLVAKVCSLEKILRYVVTEVCWAMKAYRSVKWLVV
jgi:hypothetical protein